MITALEPLVMTSENPDGNDWKPHAFIMMITSIFAVIANIWAIVVSWKARKEVKEFGIQEEPETENLS